MKSSNAKTIMSRPCHTVTEATSLQQVARLMLDKAIGAVVVVDAGGYVQAIVSDSDFCAKEISIPFSTFRAPQILGQWIGKEGVERVYQEAARRTAREVMSKPVFVVEEDDAVEKVLELMLRRGIKHVPVVRERRPVGMIARHDLLKLMFDELVG